MNAVDLTKFTEKNHIQRSNWNTQSGPYTIANCWGLSRAQRIIFYLARFGVAPENPQESSKQILDLLRDEHMDISKDGRSIEKAPLNNWFVFEINHPTLREEFLTGRTDQNNMWYLLDNGYTLYPSHGNKVLRNLRSEIEAYQKNRFYDSKNLGMALSDETDNKKRNEYLAKKLMSDITFRRMPLINLKAALTIQHVVLVKGFKMDSQKNIEFYVYDSIVPKENNKVLYNAQTGVFTAPGVFKDLLPANPAKELTVTAVDDADMSKIEDALLAYYTKKCKQ